MKTHIPHIYILDIRDYKGNAPMYTQIPNDEFILLSAKRALNEFQSEFNFKEIDFKNSIIRII